MPAELQQYVSSWVLAWCFRAEQALVASPWLPSTCTPCSREEADGDLSAEGSAFSLIPLLLWKSAVEKTSSHPSKCLPRRRKGELITNEKDAK